MNPRVLELLKEPKNIQPEDLTLLKEEINSFPYVQNIRALHLYGVHLHDKDNYQKELATTAAYTTDKKILYQLINGKMQQKQKEPEAQEKKTEAPQNFKYSYNKGSFPIKREEKAEDNTAAAVTDQGTSYLQPVPKPEIKHVYANGERNRILFEGEENFMDDHDHEVIDLESTLESGVIVTQKPQPKQPEHHDTPSEIEELTNKPEDQPVVKHDAEQTVSADPADLEENRAAEQQENPEGSVAAESMTEFSSDAVMSREEQPEEAIKETVTDPSEVNFKETESLLPETSIGKSEEENNDPEQPEETLTAEAMTEFSSDAVINREEKPEGVIKETITDPSDVSFKETEAFLPDTSVEGNNADDEQASSVDTEADEKGLDFTHEKIITEDKIDSEKTEEKVEDKTELSFHGMDSFMPDVQIKAVHKDQPEPVSVQPSINKHEEEMRRLIEEVEKKMKASRSIPEIQAEKENEDSGHEISFAETQSFVVADQEEEEEKQEPAHMTEAIGKTEQSQEENKEVHTEQSFSGIEQQDVPKEDAVQETVEESPAEQPAAAWKPMSFEAHIPDSLISKEAEIPQQQQEQQQELAPEPESRDEPVVSPALEMPLTLEEDHSEDLGSHDESLIEDPEAPIVKENDEQAPVMNVSFFSSDISSWTVDQGKKEEQREEKPADASPKPVQNPADSNVPGFINTWQSWLKIDRPQEPEKEKTEIKNKAIEAFIENNPRISQLKEESSFVIREKNDDISHLMTETLANLYFEQKLYTKAIKAFEILISKYPDKKEYFENRIKEIKDFRTKG
ncbi:hypothetical protein [uncultured Chryseobacterium sp.]|uniref:tetratricopeptide repeat protein n=1 Tax=uncultured Chryseobacterium sp. TaxID=259322 RepID=UPI0025FE429D|nr:hypothetical protein [uncultured Chryseobacterium sp.]